MDLTYQKNNNSKLFSSLVKSDLMNATNIQNYIPIYSKLFALTGNNYNSFNLKQPYYLYNITSKQSENIFQGKVKDTYGNTHTKDIFFKYSPLLDPVKYMIGKYENDKSENGKSNDNSNNVIFNLPSIMNDTSHEKMRDENNSAYVDSFFSFLSSQLLHHHGFIHGLDFYGSFLAIKNDFMLNVCDDMDYLTASPFFKKNLGQLFVLDHTLDNSHSDTRTYKEPIKIVENDKKHKLSIKLADIHDLDELDKLLVDASSENANSNNGLELVYNNEIKKDNADSDSDSGSTCSSRSSNTNSENSNIHNENDSEEDENENEEENEYEDKENKEDDKNSDGYERNKSDCDDKNEESNHIEKDVADADAEAEADDESNEEEDDESDSDDDDDETSVMATIKKFPVQLIALENCENTLDSLITQDDHKLSDEEFDSIVLQILMSLITFQKTFNFTHNDLHTNNVMYIKTDITHLYYKVNNKYYEVPTYGRIFKIIDFGRAIYKFRKLTFCSDSFNRNGDASTQYNCEPYMNQKKPRLDPNPSFDLCRLGCSIFDMIVDDLKCIENVKSPILRIIIDWCMDDKKRNVLYKNNGEERYPDFKLYKMIARTVHNHVPLKVLQNVHFDKYVIDKKKIKKIVSTTIMDIDALPCYV
jgi:hypothetical protein